MTDISTVVCMMLESFLPKSYGVVASTVLLMYLTFLWEHYSPQGTSGIGASICFKLNSDCIYRSSTDGIIQGGLSKGSSTQNWASTFEMSLTEPKLSLKLGLELSLIDATLHIVE